MSWTINFFSSSDGSPPGTLERLRLEIPTFKNSSRSMIKHSYQGVPIASVQEFERAEALV